MVESGTTNVIRSLDEGRTEEMSDKSSVVRLTTIILYSL